MTTKIADSDEEKITTDSKKMEYQFALHQPDTTRPAGQNASPAARIAMPKKTAVYQAAQVTGTKKIQRIIVLSSFIIFMGSN